MYNGGLPVPICSWSADGNNRHASGHDCRIARLYVHVHYVGLHVHMAVKCPICGQWRENISLIQPSN